MEAVGIAGTVHVAVRLDLVEGQGLVPVGAGALAEEVDPVNLGLGHCSLQIT